MNRTSPSPPVPDTSLLPESEKAASTAVDSLNRVVQSAHEAIDRLADSTAPKVRRLAETGDQWTASLRGTVRDQPLTAVTAAFALGVLLARITR